MSGSNNNNKNENNETVKRESQDDVQTMRVDRFW